MDKKYDIFISCKSEDYEYGYELYDFFTHNGYHVFFAPKSLRGGEHYPTVISNAVDTAKHYVVFTTNPDYLETHWLRAGILTRTDFRYRDDDKDTFIYFILKGFKEDTIPGMIRLFCHNRIKSFQYEDYKRILEEFK